MNRRGGKNSQGRWYQYPGRYSPLDLTLARVTRGRTSDNPPPPYLVNPGWNIGILGKGGEERDKGRIRHSVADFGRWRLFL